MKRINLLISGFIIIILISFAAFIIIIWRLGLFDYTATEQAGTAVVAAAIAFVGTIFTAVVTLIGTLIKHSIDLRNAALNEQAEKRLNQEAAIKAIQSLNSSGKEVPMTQRAGILFALTNLGLTELAVTLLCQMVNKGEIDATATDIIIDRALR